MDTVHDRRLGSSIFSGKAHTFILGLPAKCRATTNLLPSLNTLDFKQVKLDSVKKFHYSVS